MKYSVNGNVVTVTYDDGQTADYDVSKFPDNARQYTLMRGATKILSDKGAGFNGGPAELRAVHVKRWEDLNNDILRTATVTTIPTEPQLFDAMKAMAPEATKAAIEARVKAVHPDRTQDTKAKTKRTRKLREYMRDPALREALEAAGFTFPAAKPAEGLFDGLDAKK